MKKLLQTAFALSCGVGAFLAVRRLPKDAIGFLVPLLPRDPLVFNLLFCAGLLVAWALAEYVYGLDQYTTGDPFGDEEE